MSKKKWVSNDYLYREILANLDELKRRADHYEPIQVSYERTKHTDPDIPKE